MDKSPDVQREPGVNLTSASPLPRNIPWATLWKGGFEQNFFWGKPKYSRALGLGAEAGLRLADFQSDVDKLLSSLSLSFPTCTTKVSSHVVP